MGEQRDRANIHEDLAQQAELTDSLVLVQLPPLKQRPKQPGPELPPVSGQHGPPLATVLVGRAGEVQHRPDVDGGRVETLRDLVAGFACARELNRLGFGRVSLHRYGKMGIYLGPR